MSNAFDKASLVMLPHAYEEGKVYSLKPTDRSGDFTFSRGTDTATRVGEDGYIKKEYANLLLQSNQFDTTWSGSISVASGYAGYDGTNDAWLLSKGAGQYLSLVSGSLSNSGVQTYSIYCKAATLNLVTLFISYSSGNKYVEFDLTDGSVNAQTSSGIIDSGSTSLGNGWYRLYMTINESVTGVRVLPDWNNSVAGGVYIQDAQLNPGLVAYPYLETTTAPVYGGLTDDMPRLDYSGGATCPSLLLEPSRSNLWYHSEYYSGLSNSNGPIFQYNDGISPEGLQNAVRVSATNIGASRVQPSITVDGSKLVWSLYAKHEGEDYTMRFNNYLGGTGTYGAEVTVTSTAVTFDGYASGYDDADYEIIGDGWFRFWLVITPTAGGQLFQWRVLQTGSVATSYLAYGMQVEYGSYPTSYIPTYRSSQTRAAEGRNYSGFSSLIGQTEGTLFLDIDSANVNTEIFSLNRSTQNSIFLITSSTNYRVFIYSDGANLSYVTSINITDRIRVAIAYQSNNLAVYVNGSQAYTNNTQTWTPNVAMDLLNFNNGGYASSKGAARYNQVLLFKERLSNADLATLTTL